MDLDARYAASHPKDPCIQPACDIPAARDGGEVINMLNEVQMRECLKDTQIKGRAANAATGEADRSQVGICGSLEAVWTRWHGRCAAPRMPCFPRTAKDRAQTP